MRLLVTGLLVAAPAALSSPLPSSGAEPALETVRSPALVDALAADDTEVFFATVDGRIFHVSSAGGEPQPFASTLVRSKLLFMNRSAIFWFSEEYVRGTKPEDSVHDQVAAARATKM